MYDLINIKYTKEETRHVWIKTTEDKMFKTCYNNYFFACRILSKYSLLFEQTLLLYYFDNTSYFCFSFYPLFLLTF